MEKLKKLANWKTILILFILFLLFTLYLFPKYQKIINDVSNGEVVILDELFDYSKNDVDKLFNAMGEKGRDVYIYMSSVIDSVYPIVYGLLAFFIILNLTKNADNKSYLLTIFPIMTVIFDYFENFNIIRLLKKFPNITETQVEITSMLTQGKWIFLYLTFVIILILFISKLIIILKKSK
ncbi:hypothetical protein [Aureivirga marina]|uniref:hypothetical protein n=1 Tax=Aureivirga marina TaxID=1182451 RepID=UPI0018CA76DE|nr:hypothetical protein [Aureivirga marina]